MTLSAQGWKRPNVHRYVLLAWLLLLCKHVTIATPFILRDIDIRSSSNTTIPGNITYAINKPGPGEAIEENNITCVGQAPDLQLPLLPGFDPNGASMQKLCAKTQYGGGKPEQHAGGYCWIRPGTVSYNALEGNTTGEVGFDTTEAAQASVALQNPRLLLACFYRCFCSYGVHDHSVQPKAQYAFFRTSKALSFFSYELQLDMDNDFTTPWPGKRGKRGTQRVTSTRVPERSESVQTKTRSGRLGREYITLDPGNEIECRGNLPGFILPAPYGVPSADFGSLQEMCATQLNEGSMYANAGGYCHRSDTPDGPKNTVWFSDDQTPRREWTWAGGNFFASASIRFYCWQRCACKNVQSTRDNATLAVWAFVNGHELALRPSGAVTIQAGKGPDASDEQRETQVLPPQKGNGSPSGTCGVHGNEFCPQAWPSAIYGAVPRAPPNTTDVIKPSPPRTNKTVCGNTCESPSDCATPSGKNYGCSCALPTVDDARILGLDPVAPIAVCLSLFTSKLPGKPWGGKMHRRGRDMRHSGYLDTAVGKQGYVDIRGVPHTCRCNSTFVADECCEANDGVVVLR